MLFAMKLKSYKKVLILQLLPNQAHSRRVETTCAKKIFGQIWKEFKDACNKYFDKLKNTRTKTAEEIAALTIRNYTLTLCAPTN
jgi:hypothetical protein